MARYCYPILDLEDYKFSLKGRLTEASFLPTY